MEKVMLYPVYVHHDEGCAYGAIVPDMPGVITAADTLEELNAMLQEAVELMYEDSPHVPPAASDIEKYRHMDDYQDGFWMLLDVDLTRIRPRAIRLNISLPEPLVQDIDAYAKQHGQSRSGFLAQAARAAMQA